MYGYKEIKEVCKCSKSYAYSLIRKLQESFKKEYPDAIIISGKIPKHYFEKNVLGIEREDKNEEN